MKANFRRNGARRSTSGEDSPPDSDHTASLEVGTEVGAVVRVLRQLRNLSGEAMLWMTVAGLACSLRSGLWAGTAKECEC